MSVHRDPELFLNVIESAQRRRGTEEMRDAKVVTNDRKAEVEPRHFGFAPRETHPYDCKSAVTGY